jgi:hypothetical protein
VVPDGRREAVAVVVVVVHRLEVPAVPAVPAVPSPSAAVKTAVRRHLQQS